MAPTENECENFKQAKLALGKFGNGFKGVGVVFHVGSVLNRLLAHSRTQQQLRRPKVGCRQRCDARLESLRRRRLPARRNEKRQRRDEEEEAADGDGPGPDEVESFAVAGRLGDGVDDDREVAADVVHQEEEDGDARRANLRVTDLRKANTLSCQS